jgi:hypothetical protein
MSDSKWRTSPNNLKEQIALDSLKQMTSINEINSSKNSNLMDGSFKHSLIMTGNMLGDQNLLKDLSSKGWNIDDTFKMQSTLKSSYQIENKGVVANIHYYLNVKTGEQFGHKFKENAQNNNQENSHNNSNPGSPIDVKGNQGSPSGGIENKIGIISSMINSYDEIFEHDYFLAFPFERENSPFTDAELQQIIRELVNGIYVYDNVPFFSLHFNSNGSMFPIIHPAYENTLCGRVIGLLDYFMKGYLNGGFFNEKDIDTWNDSTTNQHQLVNMFDYFRNHIKDGKDYFSLRHLMQLYHIKQYGDINKYTGEYTKNTFQITFRIISEQSKIEKYQNLLMFNPDFKVEYTIEILDPGYKSTIESFKIKNGKYPPDMENLDMICQLFTQEIREKMPKLPFCKKYFEMLGVINGLCYFLKTLKKLNKYPLIFPSEINKELICPAIFPPIPVEYLKSEQILITLWNIINNLSSSEKIELDRQLVNSNKEVLLSTSLQENLLKSIRKIIPKNSISYPDEVLKHVILNLINSFKSINDDLNEGLINLRNQLTDINNKQNNYIK